MRVSPCVPQYSSLITIGYYFATHLRIVLDAVSDALVGVGNRQLDHHARFLLGLLDCIMALQISDFLRPPRRAHQELFH